MTSDDSSGDLLLVGRVARAHGNRGQVIVNPETDFAEERFVVGQVMLVGPADRPSPRRITAARFHQGRPVVALEGVSQMNDAEASRGRRAVDAGVGDAAAAGGDVLPARPRRLRGAGRAAARSLAG